MVQESLGRVDEKTRLLQRDAEWAAVASEGRDVERILGYWTDDAIVLPPGLPAVVGKAALGEYVRASFQIPGFRIAWTSTDVRFSPDGNLAYMFGRNTVTVNGADGRPATTAGRVVTVWRRDADGAWRCAVDIWNAEPAA
jgi:ketosteroid isomerase-like protein